MDEKDQLFEETKMKVYHYLQPYCEDGSFQFPEDVIKDIVIDFKLEKPYQEALEHIFSWVNDHFLSNQSYDAQKRVVYSALNMSTLIVQRDLGTFIDCWCLCDLNDYMPNDIDEEDEDD